MLTVKKLIEQTRAHRKVLLSNANIVSIAFSKTKQGKDPRGYYKMVWGSAKTNKPGKRAHKFEIRLYWSQTRAKTDQYIPPELREKGQKYLGPEEAPPFNLDSLVWVSCSCEYFLYNCEVADAETDNSTVKYSNGAFPKITNPQGVGHLCKHLISAFKKGALVKK